MRQIVLAICAVTAVISAGVVTGVVRDAAGNPIPNAIVSIPALKIQQSADASGTYTLTNVSAGTYDVLFGATNYQTGYLRDVTFEGTAIVDESKSQVYRMDLKISGISGTQQINFVIPEGVSSSVKIRLHDLRGRVVSEIANGNFSAGMHSVLVPAGLSCGVYAVQMVMGSRSLVHKIVIQ